MVVVVVVVVVFGARAWRVLDGPRLCAHVVAAVRAVNVISAQRRCSGVCLVAFVSEV